MALLLGLDLGTSSVKAVLFNPESASIIATATQEYPVLKPRPDHAEQNPDDWLNAVATVTRRVVKESGRQDVAAIGLSGQMHGGVLLNKQLEPLHPAIIWSDQRSAEVVPEIIKTVGAERYAQLAGTLPATGFMASTLVWLARENPQLLSQVHTFLMPKDVVRLMLTGEAATDPSDAAATALFDVHAVQWSAEIINTLGLPDNIYAPIAESGSVAGQLTASAAEKLGLSVGTPVIVGSADQPAQAIGNGLVKAGKASVTIGSGGQVFVPFGVEVRKFPTDKRLHTFNHALPEMWYILGATLSAGLSLRWLRDLVGLEINPNAYALLSESAAGVPVGADGLIFLPYLSGERTPHMDAKASGVFIGLNSHHGRGHLARAVMEGVTFALRQVLDIAFAYSNPVDSLIIAGGAANSDVWRQIQAAVFGLPLVRNQLNEQAGVGAAILAGTAIGYYPDLASACEQVVHYKDTTAPEPNAKAIYDDLYGVYTGLYPKLMPDMHRLKSIALA